MHLRQQKVQSLLETLALHWADQSPALASSTRGNGLTLPSIPTVYLLTDSEQHLVYVGQTNNLRARIAQHEANTKMTSSSWAETHWMEPGIADHHRRLMVETCLIATTCPPLNSAVLLKLTKGRTLSEIRWTRKRHG